MSNYQQKPNTGAMFKNKNKDADNKPDYKGTFNIEGKSYEIAGWIKNAGQENQYLSLKIQQPYVKTP